MKRMPNFLNDEFKQRKKLKYRNEMAENSETERNRARERKEWKRDKIPHQ